MAASGNTLRSIKRLSPAKLNLILKVEEKKRSDGYHSLTTLFERINLADEMEFREERSGINILCHSRGVPRDEENLAYRAAELLKKTCKIKSGVSIRLKKNIPVAAGLGGGSSNAASTLLGLNRLWRLGLHRKSLLNLSAQLGADVSFFVLESPFAIGTGRGDTLQPISFKGTFKHLLVYPAKRTSLKGKTAAIYQGFDRKIRQKKSQERFPEPNLTPLSLDVKILHRFVKNRNAIGLRSLLFNSLEQVVFRHFRRARDIKEALLDSGCLASLVSGSGPTVFGILNEENAMLHHRIKPPFKGWQFCLSKTLHSL